MVMPRHNNPVNERLLSNNDPNVYEPGHQLTKYLRGINSVMEGILHRLQGDEIDIDQFLYEPSLGTIVLSNPTRQPWLLTDILATWQTTQAIGPGQSVSGEGSVTTPAAGATIATILSGSLPAGNYSVEVTFNITGTVTQGTDNNNIELVGSTTQILDNEIAAGDQYFGPFTVTLNGSQALSIKAIGLGTTGSIYSALIVATPISNIPATPSSGTITTKGRTLQITPAAGTFQALGMHGIQMDKDAIITFTLSPAVPMFLEVCGKSDYRKMERVLTA